MEILYEFVSPPSPCGYLPHRVWSLEYEMVGALTPAEYQQQLEAGWRRFGTMLFHPRCPSCSACQSLRVLVEDFRPNRSQQRTIKANIHDVELVIAAPSVSRRKLDLYDRYHAFQSLNKGWTEHAAKDAESFCSSFIDNPIPTEEWCYYLEGELIGVGYVDVLPASMSAIYFFYEPELRNRSLGTWNVLSLLAEARLRCLPHMYLGYFVADCPSLAYKANFTPNEVLGTDSRWRRFR
ncbi:MAG: arginyltransferase [Planctomycetes bacterium]|nr:arginyltransferase [Planctomycetota bacterium]